MILVMFRHHVISPELTVPGHEAMRLAPFFILSVIYIEQLLMLTSEICDARRG